MGGGQTAGPRSTPMFLFLFTPGTPGEIEPLIPPCLWDAVLFEQLNCPQEGLALQKASQSSS